MKKTNEQQKNFTAITFQGVSVKVLQINAETKEEAEAKLIGVLNNLSDDEAFKLDDIMEHKKDLSYAVFDADSIKSV